MLDRWWVNGGDRLAWARATCPRQPTTRHPEPTTPATAPGAARVVRVWSVGRFTRTPAAGVGGQAVAPTIGAVSVTVDAGRCVARCGLIGRAAGVACALPHRPPARDWRENDESASATTAYRWSLSSWMTTGRSRTGQCPLWGERSSVATQRSRWRSNRPATVSARDRSRRSVTHTVAQNSMTFSAHRQACSECSR
ncbi:MAG: hypothetical protein JWN03_3226 [Nocardia sp.]|nr:hypothetical protein [Nocardia sp.]